MQRVMKGGREQIFQRGSRVQSSGRTRGGAGAIWHGVMHAWGKGGPGRAAGQGRRGTCVVGQVHAPWLAMRPARFQCPISGLRRPKQLGGNPATS